jgi:hypothetical protein
MPEVANGLAAVGTIVSIAGLWLITMGIVKLALFVLWDE